MQVKQVEDRETWPSLIITAHAEFLDSAVNELRRLERQLRTLEVLAPGIMLCSVPDVGAFTRTVSEAHPTFVRHLFPVQAIIPLNNTEADIEHLAINLASLPTFAMLERGQRFAVQTRLVQSEEGVKRSYSGGKINQLLAEAIVEETGAVEDIKRPQIIVSILCMADKAYLGISLARNNLSAWPGGMRHFAQTEEQISRAEFKLLEALDVFGLSLPARGQALDLGAAPGGWTRLLLDAGLSVTAVDPARLDPRLARQARLIHYRGYTEAYLEDLERRRQHPHFDVITNDMRMDARDAARLLIQMRGYLQRDGFILSTLKLPHATASIDPLKNLREATSLLSRFFNVVQSKQLFHNRQEVTIVAADPRQREL